MIMEDVAYEIPKCDFHRAMMRDAFRMRNIFTRRTNRIVLRRRSSVAFWVSASIKPICKSKSKGSDETRSMLNHPNR